MPVPVLSDLDRDALNRSGAQFTLESIGSILQTLQIGVNAGGGGGGGTVATTGQAQAGTNDTAFMSPLKSRQAAAAEIVFNSGAGTIDSIASGTRRSSLIVMTGGVVTLNGVVAKEEGARIILIAASGNVTINANNSATPADQLNIPTSTLIVRPSATVEFLYVAGAGWNLVNALIERDEKSGNLASTDFTWNGTAPLTFITGSWNMSRVGNIVTLKLYGLWTTDGSSNTIVGIDLNPFYSLIPAPINTRYLPASCSVGVPTLTGCVLEIGDRVHCNFESGGYDLIEVMVTYHTT